MTRHVLTLIALTLTPLAPLGGAAPLAAATQADDTAPVALESAALDPAAAEALRLLRTLRDPAAPGPAVVAPALAELGPAAAEELLRCLETRAVRDPLAPDGEAQLLSEPQRDAVLGGLAALGRERVLPLWEARYAAPVDAARVPAALLSLGASGGSRDLERLWQLGRDAAGEAPLDARVSAALQQALTLLFRHDPRAFLRVQATWSGLPDDWHDELVEAVGAAGDSRGLELLAEMETWAPEQRRRIASKVPLLGPCDAPAVNRGLAEALHAQLREGEKEDVQATLAALAVLEDFRCVEELVALLEDERPGVPQGAHHALRKLTNKQLDGRAALWKRWFRDEREWLERERDAVVGRLRSSNDRDVLIALREISRHRLERHELALEVGPKVWEGSEEVRLTAVQTLAELGSRWGGRDLLLALDDESEAVRAAALDALTRITGERHGPAPADWQGVALPERLY